MNSADLSRELRAARPVAGDALREHVRAIAAAPPERRRSLLTRFSPRRLVLVAVPAAAVIVAAVAGVASLLGSEQPQRMANTPPTIASSAAAGDALAPSAKAGAAGTESFATTVPAPTPDRAQRYSAQLTISVEDNDALSKATQSALAATRRLGGHVTNVQYATAESGAASMTLRVPTESVQEAIVGLSGLGTIVAQNIQIDDLQEQVDTLIKREAALRERIARLSARITAPGTDAATRATLVARRDAARGDLARLRAQSSGLEAEASMATIDLRLQTEQGSAVPVPPPRFDRALAEAGRILALEAAAVLFAFVLAGPILLGALAVWLARRLVSRARPAWR